MNIYKESLREIKNIVLDEHADGYWQPRTVEDFYNSAIKNLEAAVEQVTPKKYKTLTIQKDTYTITHAVCPKCGEIIDDFEGYAGCPLCLQAIDWSDLND